MAWIPWCYTSDTLSLASDPFPGSGHILLILALNWEGSGGLRFLSPHSCNLKLFSCAWQSCSWKCSSPLLTDGPFQSPVVQVSQKSPMVQKRQIPGYNTSSITIHWSALFNWSFQITFLWPEGFLFFDRREDGLCFTDSFSCSKTFQGTHIKDKSNDRSLRDLWFKSQCLYM